MKKINIADILKDCPKGMELDCTLYDNASLLDVDSKEGIIFPIRVLREDGNSITLTKYGQITDADFAKCVIFPKGKTTWEGFVPPCKFKDGDIIADEHGNIAIYKGTMWYNKKLAGYYCGYRKFDNCFIPEPKKDGHFGSIEEIRFATEKEKVKLFQVIKDNDYYWNAETKTLVKLVTNRFDITTLVPFKSRVLVRDYDNRIWFPVFWGKRLEDNSNCRYLTTNGCYKYCIPYEGNEHLLGTTNDCDDFYKTWEQ